MSYKFAVAAVALAAQMISTHAFAAKPMQVVHVSLTGEAGQPMGAKLDVTEIKAGTVEFDVSNDAVGTDHEAVLVKLDKKDAVLSVDPKKHRIDEGKLNTLGEVAGLQAGSMKKLKVTLKPGEYALICNHKSHFELGMTTRFTVVK